MATINADKIEINTLFDSFWFLIPEYQRSYVWNSDNINELVDDLWYGYKNRENDEYFLGSLVLKKTLEEAFNEYEVLDGQQRLTTLFIIMAVLRDTTDNPDLKKACHDRVFQKANKFKKIPERIRLKYNIRDNVGEFINEYILNDTIAIPKKNKLKELSNDKNISINHMAKAILTISDFFSNKEPQEIEGFGEFIAEKPVFIYVSTGSMEDAFRMFTILNNRGIPLTNADILKSINIGLINKDKQKDYAKSWESVESDLNGDFDRFLSYIRTILVKEKARLNLLDEFNENIYQKNKLVKGINTIEFISKYKLVYDKIITFQEKIELENDYKNLVTIMDIGLPSTDWVPALMLYFNKFEKKLLLPFLKKLEYKFSSDWIIQLTPTKRIENLNLILKSIEKSYTPEELLNNYELFKVDNEELAKRLDGKVYGRRFARYILLKHEYILGDDTVHLSDYKTISVEHVLPQNPKTDSKWVSIFNDEDRKIWTNKLANLMLINKRKNSSLGNLDFMKKSKKYLNGRMDIFPSNKVFQKYDEWNVEVLNQRQREMIEKLIQ